METFLQCISNNVRIVNRNLVCNLLRQNDATYLGSMHVSYLDSTKILRNVAEYCEHYSLSFGSNS
jgi:hypothetical protein